MPYIREREVVEANRLKLLHILVGIVLFVLIAGIWACLWVPPL